MTTSDQQPPAWALDRELVLCRVIDAPRERVFQAWTTPDIGRWFGPEGFSCITHEMEVRPGGRWRFDLTAPDGAMTWPSRVEYVEVVPSERLVFDHGSDIDDDPERFRVTVTFDEQGDGKTVLTMRNLLPTPEQRAASIEFGAVELGYQTLAKLERFILED